MAQGVPHEISPKRVRIHSGTMMRKTMRTGIIQLLALAVLLLAADVLVHGQQIQDQQIKDQQIPVKGGHQLGETGEQFFAEGYEKEMLSACATGDFKSVNKSSTHQLKEYCAAFAEVHQQAISGKRTEYKGSGDVSELRTDTFTFDKDRLVKAELLYSVPTAEVNYRGQSFEEIFTGVKQAYGPPVSETTKPVQDAYGVPYIAHRELWLLPHAAILITDKPVPGGSTTVVAFTREEYDRTVAGDAAKAANPLQ